MAIVDAVEIGPLTVEAPQEETHADRFEAIYSMASAMAPPFD